MKCNECKNIGFYTTGMDEYPQYTTISYCKKGHWENGPEPLPEDEQEDPWGNCADFEAGQPHKTGAAFRVCCTWVAPMKEKNIG